MIVDSLANGKRYAGLHPRLERCFAWLQQQSLDTLALGRHEVEGNELFVTCSHDRLQPVEERPFENHHEYIDIHIPLSATERIGWAPVEALSQPRADYDALRDIQFFDDAVTKIVPVCPGEFMLLFPQEAHAPLIGEGCLEKVIVKIKL